MMKVSIIPFGCLVICAIEGSVLKFIPGLKSADKKLHVPVPDFCNKLDCPRYKVVSSTAEYELRTYVATQWVSDATKGVSFNVAQYTNFMKLFGYIQGNNAAKKKIAMTAPVLTKIIPGPGPACDDDFTMSFFVSPSEATPPKPTDSSVYLTKNVSMTAYVRSFPGYVRSVDTWLKEAGQLEKALEGKEYVKDYYFTAGYNSPFQLTNRHNEIWFLTGN